MACGTLGFACSAAVGPRIEARVSPAVRRAPACELYRRALAVDYGLARVGLAVSLGFAPRALRPATHRADPRAAARAVAAAARAHAAPDIVVGLPLTAAGLEGDQAAATRLFARALIAEAPWARIFLLDERFTTQLARAALLDAKVPASHVDSLVDSASAVEIASRFFSDVGEVKPILLHEPADRPASLATDEKPASQDTVDAGEADQASFFAWKRNAMARAMEDFNETGGKRRRYKKGRRKK